MTTTDFREEQRINMWWVWLAVAVPAVIIWMIFLEQIVGGRPYGSHPGPNWVVWVLWVLLGLGVPALFLILRLTITVSASGVHIRYYPFINRLIPFSDIRAFHARRYRPIREFGGWGIRSGLGNKSAYNAKGNLGVEIYLHDGRSIMLGSQRHEDLATALRSNGVAEAAAPPEEPERSHWLPGR